MEYARSRKNADLSGENTAKRDLLAILREKVEAQASGFDQYYARAFVAVMDIRAFFEFDMI